MRRPALLIGSLLVLAGASTVAPARDQVPRPPLQAHAIACETGPDPADRFAVFGASMPSAPGVVSMAMRFTLYEARPGGTFHHVALPHWDVWDTTTRRGVPGFIFSKRLERLDAPAAFHAVVSFRWSDAAGRVSRSARRTSADCRQPDPRPDLRVIRVTPPAVEGLTEVVVRNRGRGYAPAFRIDGARAGVNASESLAGLPAGEQTTVSLSLGRCVTGQSVTVTLDAANQVDEAHEADNVTTVTCTS